MLFKDIINVITTKNPSVTKKSAHEITKALLDKIAKELISGESVRLEGVGTIKVVTREKKASYDINQKRVVQRPATTTLKITPNKNIRELLNERPQ